MDDCLGRLKYTTVGQASARQTGRSPVVYHESHRSAMRNLAVFLILAPCLLTAQGRGAPAAAPAAAGIVGRDFVRENYSKFEPDGRILCGPRNRPIAAFLKGLPEW